MAKYWSVWKYYFVEKLRLKGNYLQVSLYPIDDIAKSIHTLLKT
jgi:hypothetical protein